jgi:predicted NAD/FAD-dependent oxidoreductase
VPLSLPARPPGILGPEGRSGRRANGVWRCGDGCETASIEGAVVSGTRVAEALVD